MKYKSSYDTENEIYTDWYKYKNRIYLKNKITLVFSFLLAVSFIVIILSTKEIKF